MSKAVIDWLIDPYQGVGPIRFGMTAEAVADILGASSETKPGASLSGNAKQAKAAKPLTEFRTDPKTKTLLKNVPVVHYEHDQVVMLDFLKTATTLRLGDMPLFEGKRQTVIDTLIDQSTTVFETFEGYLFLDVGLSMMSAENARGSASSGTWNIGVYANRQHFDALIKECLADELGEYIKGGPN